jgi:DNA repair protein RecN (Recombination protein N)
MLRFLSVRHLAVIDRLEVEFEPGFSVLTGETGAGKSILVGAIGLLVGGRAASDLVRTGEDTAVVEAIFEPGDGREVILRREVSAQGRSRAFLDGALTTTAALRDATAGLVDLHGQHEHQLLLDPQQHLDFLDEFAGAGTIRHQVSEAFARWEAVRAERERLLANEREGTARAEFLAFQLAEIERIAPRAGEDIELAATRQVLANADKLQRLCGDAYDALYEGEHAALPALGAVWRRVSELAAIDERFGPYLDVRDAVKPQLEDLAFFLRSYAAGIDASPARLHEVEDRLAALDRLKKKHGPTLDDVVARAARLRQDLDDIEHRVERAARLDADVDSARTGYLQHAQALSTLRRDHVGALTQAMERSLAELAMTRTRCEIRFATAEVEGQWTARGIETAEFYISPNPGEEPRPLARIASGGELSRIMLALRTIAATDAPGKTLIFDEVDSGIGGAVADVVGSRLQRLARRFQVLCITHLPQIAACAATQYHIEKAVRDGRTLTSVSRLDRPQRELEIARMIAGSEISATVRASAREMLAARGGAKVGGAKGETKAKGESERRRPQRGA